MSRLVPAMDTSQRVARITLKTMGAYGFDHRANWVAKVRNVSRLGSHQKSAFQFCTLRVPPQFSTRTCCIATASTHRSILVRFRQQHSLKLRHQFRKILVPFGIGNLGITEQHDSYAFARNIVN